MTENTKYKIRTSLMFDDIEEDAIGEVIQLTDEDEEGDALDASELEELPVLPIKNTVLFPGVVIPITVSRAKSVKLVKQVYKDGGRIGVITQQNSAIESPKVDELHRVGTVAKIIKMLVLPDGNTTIIIQGKGKFEIEEVLQEDPHLTVKPRILSEPFFEFSDEEGKVLMSTLKETANKIFKLNPDIPQ